MIDTYPSDWEETPRSHIRGETQAELVDRRMRESEARWAAHDAAMAPPGQRVPCACLPAFSPSMNERRDRGQL